jgi:hypothetical protein
VPHILQLLYFHWRRSGRSGSSHSIVASVRNFLPDLCGRYDDPTGREWIAQERGEDGAITDQESGISITPECVPTPPLPCCVLCVLRRGWRTVADAAKIKKVLVQKRINGTPQLRHPFPTGRRAVAARL